MLGESPPECKFSLRDEVRKFSPTEGENIESSCVPKILTAKIKVHDFERYVLNFWIVACVQIGGENFLEFHFL